MQFIDINWHFCLNKYERFPRNILYEIYFTRYNSNVFENIFLHLLVVVQSKHSVVVAAMIKMRIVTNLPPPRTYAAHTGSHPSQHHQKPQIPKNQTQMKNMGQQKNNSAYKNKTF